MIYDGRKIKPPKPHKYGVCAAEDRTYGVNDKGEPVVYGSAAEAERAQELDLLLRGQVIMSWKRQVPFKLGDIKYVADFVVHGFNPRQVLVMWVEEIKGVETQRFKLVRRLWKLYGPFPMLIYKRRGKGWDVEHLEGAPHA